MDFLRVGNTLIWFIFASTLCWLALKLFILPSLKKSIFSRNGDLLPFIWGKVAFYGAFKSVFGIIALAGVTVLALFKGLQFWLESQDKAEESLHKIVSFRNNFEGIIESFQTLSMIVWIGALVVIALIWATVSRSGSRKRWLEAVGARKKAISATIQDLTIDELRDRLSSNEQRLTAFDENLEAITEGNKAKVEACYDLPVFEFEGASESLSVNMLKDLVSVEGEDPDTAEIRDDINKKISEFEQEFSISLNTLSGSDKEVSLNTAWKSINPTEEEIRTYLIESIVDEDVKNHQISAENIAKKEPELISEWLGAAATSESTVKATSWGGRMGGYGALVAIFLSFLGFSALSLGPNIINTAQALELNIITSQHKPAVAEPPVAESESKEDEAANDQQAVDYLRNSFRVSAIHNLTGANRKTPSSATVRRHLQQITAAEVRRNILSKSKRLVAAPLDRGAARHVYEVSHHLSGTSATDDVAKIFDDAISRRIAELQNDRMAWDKIKLDASKSSSAKYASNAFFNTLLVPDDLARSHALKMYADQAAQNYAKAIINSQNIPPSSYSRILFEESHSVLTNRDKKIIAGFRTEVPNYLDNLVTAYNNGNSDPGSLKRVMPKTISSIPIDRGAVDAAKAARAAVSISQYDRLFPSESGKSITGKGNGVSTARSFKRIRFSGRVGGVVIGIEPSSKNDGINVTGFDWIEADDVNLEIKIQTSDGRTISLGSFNTAIAHYALAYAADGRVVTTTLPQPLRGKDDDEFFIDARRVVVHPAFEDTTFACFAIQVDRFVDGYMFDDEQLKEARRAVTNLGALISSVLRLGESREIISLDREALQAALSSNGSDDELVSTINRMVDSINARAESVAEYAKKCTNQAECFPVETYSKQGFDFSGVTKLLSCLSEYGAARCKKELSLLSSKSSYLVDSGVRERGFMMDENFDFLNLSKNEDDPLWPLDFIIQAVPQTLTGGDVEVSGDSEPWNFPLAADRLRTIVESGVKNDPGAQTVLENMKQFVVLQRLFRLALDGSLGVDFPLQKLVSFQEKTKKRIKIHRHERWNYNSSFVNLLESQSSYFESKLSSLEGNLTIKESCKSEISTALENKVELWVFLGDIESFCDTSQGIFSKILDRRNILRGKEILDEFIYFLKVGRIRHKEKFYCPNL